MLIHSSTVKKSYTPIVLKKNIVSYINLENNNNLSEALTLSSTANYYVMVDGKYDFELNPQSISPTTGFNILSLSDCVVAFNY